MNKIEKSLLDGTRVQDEAFPLRKIPVPNTRPLEIVSNCPKCGSPIYGPRSVSPDIVTVAIRYTCECLHATKTTLEGTTWTK